MATRQVGAFIEIPLSNGKFCYGRILDKADFAFYNIYVDEPLKDIKEIATCNVLFIIAVDKYAITKKHWLKIGVLPLEDYLNVLPMKFMQDLFDPDKFDLYNPNNGAITPATREECLNLERSAVWAPNQVEDRLTDYFEGRPNVWIEQMKIK